MELEQLKTDHPTKAGSAAAVLLLLLSAIIIFFAFSQVHSARGTDQFWYLADTNTLVEEGANHSNLTMPGVILRQNNGNPATPFYHNGPLLHINALITRLLGVDHFKVWKVNNFLFAAVAALLTSLLVANITNRRFGIYAFCIYVLSPLNIWLVVNSLQETFYAFLLSIQIYITVRFRHSAWLFPILLVSLIAGAYSHPFFKLIALSICLIYLIDKRYVQSVLIFSAVALVVTTQQQLFATSFPPDLSTLIAYSVPGKSNGLWHQSDYTLFVTPELLVDKTIRAITVQFTDLKVPLLSIITYLSIPAFFILAFKREKSTQMLLWLSAIAFCLYAGIVVLMQFQVRYQQIIAPATVAILALTLFFVCKRYAGFVALVLAIGFFAIDLKLISRASTDASKFDSSSKDFAEFVSAFPDDQRIAFINDKQLGSYLYLVSSARPRQVMVVGTHWLSDKSYARAMELFQPDLLIYSESELDKISNNGNLIEIADFHKVGKLFYEHNKTP